MYLLNFQIAIKYIINGINIQFVFVFDTLLKSIHTPFTTFFPKQQLKKSCESASPLFCFKFMAQMGGQMRISLHFQLSGQHNFKV